MHFRHCCNKWKRYESLSARSTPPSFFPFHLFLQSFQSGDVSIPKAIESPSFFIPKTFFPSVDTEDEVFHRLFVDAFLQAGRVSHLNRVMALHPSYFERYYTTYNFIMRESGPLPFEWRNYIAILVCALVMNIRVFTEYSFTHIVFFKHAPHIDSRLCTLRTPSLSIYNCNCMQAAARHKCEWLVNWQEREFVMNGGNVRWLDGLDYIPQKLRSLLEVNQILSHQPWLLTKDHIAVSILLPSLVILFVDSPHFPFHPLFSASSPFCVTTVMINNYSQTCSE